MCVLKYDRKFRSQFRTLLSPSKHGQIFFNNTSANVYHNINSATKWFLIKTVIIYIYINIIVVT